MIDTLQSMIMVLTHQLMLTEVLLQTCKSLLLVMDKVELVIVKEAQCKLHSNNLHPRIDHHVLQLLELPNTLLILVEMNLAESSIQLRLLTPSKSIFMILKQLQRILLLQGEEIHHKGRQLMEKIVLEELKVQTGNLLEHVGKAQFKKNKSHQCMAI
jgi:hypothetical protein